MHELDFGDLRRQLLRGGIKPRYVKRTIKELQYHYSDLESDARADGFPPEDAAELASTRLGDQDLIVEEVLSRPELKSWAHRWPKTIYLLSPVVILITIITLLTMLIVGIGLITIPDFTLGGPVPVWFQSLVGVTGFFMMYILGQVITIILFLFAYNRQAPYLWPLIGIIVLSVVGSGVVAQVVWPAGQEGQLGSFTMGIGIDITRFFVSMIFTTMFVYFYTLFRLKSRYT